MSSSANLEKSFLLVASDVHSDSEVFERLCALASSDKCLAFLYAGDLEADDYFIQDCLRKRNFTFLPVRGNCDNPYDWTDTGVPFPPLFRTCSFANLNIWMSHGHVYSEPDNPQDYDLVITGHTHKNSILKVGNTVFLNPGSAARPRGRSCASYAVVEISDSLALVSTRVLDSAVVIEQCEIRIKQ